MNTIIETKTFQEKNKKKISKWFPDAPHTFGIGTLFRCILESIKKIVPNVPSGWVVSNADWRQTCRHRGWCIFDTQITSGMQTSRDVHSWCHVGNTLEICLPTQCFWLSSQRREMSSQSILNIFRRFYCIGSSPTSCSDLSISTHNLNPTNREFATFTM